MEKININTRQRKVKILNRNTHAGDILDVTIILSIAFLITLILYFLLLVPSLPETAAREYIDTLKKGEYEKASLFLINIPNGMTDTNEISIALQDTYRDCDSMSIKSLSVPVNSNMCSVTVDIDKDGIHHEENILLLNSKDSIFHFKKEWKVVCPFETAGVVFKGIDGCRVFMDDEEIGTIKNGELNAGGIISCNHNFRLQLDGIGESDNVKAAVKNGTNEVELVIKPFDEFADSIKKVISSFCMGWGQYCLTRKADSIKPYLTQSMYLKYTGDSSRFQGSKYTICQGEVTFKDIGIENADSIYYTVDEKWHMKESITDRTFVFKDNGKAELEQVQYLTWKYHIINDGGVWRIGSAEQLSYRQEILNP